MAMVECSKCEREISDSLSVCNYCGTPLNNAKKIDYANVSYFKTETEENIYFILKVAQVLRGILYICAAIIIVSTFFIFGFDDETFAGILLGCIVAFIGFLITPFLEWKAYMLQNIYELNQNTKKIIRKQDN